MPRDETWVQQIRMKDFEKLGVFYLGRESDPSGAKLGEPVLYDSRHLRHARASASA